MQYKSISLFWSSMIRNTSAGRRAAVGSASRNGIRHKRLTWPRDSVPMTSNRRSWRKRKHSKPDGTSDVYEKKIKDIPLSRRGGWGRGLGETHTKDRREKAGSEILEDSDRHERRPKNTKCGTEKTEEKVMFDHSVMGFQNLGARKQ